MKKLLGATFVAALLLTGASTASAQVSFGIRIGPPPAPRVVRIVPRSPGADYVWVNGYWYPVGSRYRWHDGYWTRPPYRGARWVQPRYESGRFYQGFWDDNRGRADRDRRGRDRNRDYRYDRDRRRR